MRHLQTTAVRHSLVSIAFYLAALTAMAPSVHAQLGPGDLQAAHALTANTAGWVALRNATRQIVDATAVVTDGSPEEAADTLAVFLALEDGQGRLDSILIGAVRGALMAYASSDAEASRGFATIGLTRSRAKAIACLIYGNAPEKRTAIVDALELVASEIEYCPKAYARLRDHWLPVAAPLRASVSGSGQPASVELAPAGGAMASARAVLVAGQTLHEVGAFVSTALTSPRSLLIRSALCEDGTVPAPADEVRVCYELIGDIATGIERGIVASR